MYAKGSRAWGICDKTGFRYPLKDLVDEIVLGKKTGRRVGRDVVDPDHPQNYIGRVKANDPMALRDPRPDTGKDASRALWGWNPVGNPAQSMLCSAGTISWS